MIVHSIFESIALGVLNDLPIIYSLAFAIFLHKWAECMIVGFLLNKYKLRGYSSIVLLMMFILSAPLGILIGWYLNDISSSFNAIMLSICSGIYLYISLIDIMVEEFSKEKENKLLKLLFVIIGILLIGVTTMFE